MNANSGMGAKNPVDIDVTSEIHPINGGNSAPPTIDITMKDDPFLVWGPKFFIPRAKIVGNIIDIKKKTRNKDTIENHPILLLTTGSNMRHANEYSASRRVGFTKVIM